MKEAQRQIDDGTGLQSHQIEQGRGLLRRAHKTRSKTAAALARKIGVESATSIEATLKHYNDDASKFPPKDTAFSKATKWVRPLKGDLYAVDCSLTANVSRT